MADETQAIANTRGVLTAHFNSIIHLDYPCTLAVTTAPEGPKANTANPMSAGIPFVANIAQATLEIKKSRLFVEKHHAFKMEQALQTVATMSGLGGKRGRNDKNKKGGATPEELAAKAKEEGILSDPYAVIEGAHFVLNALPHIGNTGRPLALCHFLVEKGCLVLAEEDGSKKSAAVVSSSSSAAAEGEEATLAVVRVPIHLSTSVGQQGKADNKPKKKKEKAPALPEGASTGLAGLELIYVPRRAPKKDAAAAEEEKAEEKPKLKNNMYNKGKNNKKDDKKDAGANRPARDVFPAPYFDVSVTISGVQHTYLLSSQFDVLAGRTQQQK